MKFIRGFRSSSAIVLAFSVIGFGYTQLSPREYTAKVPFSIHYDFDNEMVETVLFSSLGSEWVKENNQEIGEYISFKTANKNPFDIEVYEQLFDKIGKSVNEKILAQHKLDLNIIQEFDKSFLNTNSAAENLLEARRVIFQIENAGTSAVSFKNPKLHLVPPKAILILALSIVLAGFLGVVTVLTLNAIKSRKPS